MIAPPQAPASGSALDSDASFTLDADVLAGRRAASARRLHTVQIPTVRAAGFAILCVIAFLQDVRMGGAPDWPHLELLIALNQWNSKTTAENRFT